MISSESRAQEGMRQAMTCELVAVGSGAAMVCSGSNGSEYRIFVGQRVWLFEWHGYLGPCALHRRTGREINASTAFLEAAGLWDKQGRRMDAEGLCVWEPEPEERMVHLAGKHWAIVPDGQTPEEVREEWLSIIKPKLPR